MLGHKCSFPNSHLLDSGRKEITKRHQVSTANPATGFTEIVCTTVIVSYVSASNYSLFAETSEPVIVFFADFLVVRELLVKNYQIKLLKKVWCVLLVLCT